MPLEAATVLAGIEQREKEILLKKKNAAKVKEDALTVAKTEVETQLKIQAAAQEKFEREKDILLQLQANALALAMAQAEAQSKILRQSEAVAIAAANSLADAEKKAREQELAVAKDELQDLAKFHCDVKALSDSLAEDFINAQNRVQSLISEPTASQHANPQPSAPQPTAPTTAPRRSIFRFFASSKKNSLENRVASLETSFTSVTQKVSQLEDTSNKNFSELNNSLKFLVAAATPKDPIPPVRIFAAGSGFGAEAM